MHYFARSSHIYSRLKHTLNPTASSSPSLLYTPSPICKICCAITSQPCQNIQQIQKKEQKSMSDLNPALLPILKRISHSQLNLKPFEKSRSKSPKIIRFSNISNNLPKLYLHKDVVSYPTVLDLRRSPNKKEGRLSHLVGQENFVLSVKGEGKRDEGRRVSGQLIAIVKKRYNQECIYS